MNFGLSMDTEKKKKICDEIKQHESELKKKKEKKTIFNFITHSNFRHYAETPSLTDIAWSSHIN